MSISLGGRPRLLLAVGATALLAPAAIAEAASAATLRVNKACYVYTSRTPPPVTVTGAGFAPATAVQLTSGDGSIDKTVTADAAGNIAIQVQGPSASFTAANSKLIKLTATDNGPAGPIAAATGIKIAPFGFSHGGTKKAPGLKALTETTDWAFSGFPVGKTIWGHYLIGGKPVARQAFGKAKGDCGVLKTRRPLYPATPHHSSYRFQVDARKKYSRKALPRVVGKIGLTLSF